MKYFHRHKFKGDLRTRVVSARRSSVIKPIITVITVVRNGELHLEQSIRSVLSQTYDGIEHIVIDGGSTDNTLNIIKRYDDKIAYWSSEPDRGIYDAMNKGIDAATGEWICFLNAGDEFSHAHILSALVAELRDDCDVLFGRHEETYSNGYSRTPTLGNLQDLWKGMVFCHQSMLVRTELMRGSKFNIQNSIAADYEFIYALFSEQRRFHPVDRVITRVLADGFSASNNLAQTREQWRIARRYSGRTAALDCYYVFTFARIACNNMLKAVLPKRLINYLRSR